MHRVRSAERHRPGYRPLGAGTPAAGEPGHRLGASLFRGGFRGHDHSHDVPTGLLRRLRDAGLDPRWQGAARPRRPGPPSRPRPSVPQVLDGLQRCLARPRRAPDPPHDPQRAEGEPRPAAGELGRGPAPDRCPSGRHRRRARRPDDPERALHRDARPGGNDLPAAPAARDRHHRGLARHDLQQRRPCRTDLPVRLVGDRFRPSHTRRCAVHSGVGRESLGVRPPPARALAGHGSRHRRRDRPRAHRNGRRGRDPPPATARNRCRAGVRHDARDRARRAARPRLHRRPRRRVRGAGASARGVLAGVGLAPDRRPGRRDRARRPYLRRGPIAALARPGAPASADGRERLPRRRDPAGADRQPRQAGSRILLPERVGPGRHRRGHPRAAGARGRGLAGHRPHGSARPHWPIRHERAPWSSGT